MVAARCTPLADPFRDAAKAGQDRDAACLARLGTKVADACGALHGGA